MKVSLSWLREYVPIAMETQELADALTMCGLEVEAVENRYESLTNVVVSRILEVAPHPNADKLHLCKVDVGDQVLSIVCGAPNAAEGLMIPCALVGATLPNGIAIKKGKLRGELSEGMLCSAAELGLSLERSGIMELVTDAAPGTPLVDALGLKDATIDVSITPNRPDCLSVMGVAREIGAFEAHKTRITYPDPNTAAVSDQYGPITQYTSVEIKDPDLCPRYSARLVFDVTVGPSPFWLQDKLISVGLKPINNIVDVTNFVMMETGQPLHAFDFDHLTENRIVVRAAGNGEKFTTLDEKEHTLDSEMLMICDGQKPVALGGVMGGLNSEISDGTTRVLIESAYFTPTSIRKTSKKTGLSTDAAYRFERGTDPDGVIFALNRAASLITAIGKGNLVTGIIDAYPKPIEKKEITVDINALNKRLGTRLSRDEIKGYLESVEMTVTILSDNALKVVPPSFRVDIERPEDMSEEVARLWGYNKIRTTFPQIPAEAFELSPNIQAKRLVRAILSGMGFSETIHYSFIHSDSVKNLGIPEQDPRRDMIEIMNPLTEDQKVMRTTLLPSLLTTIQHNNDRQERDLALFEIGNVFYKQKDSELARQVEMLAGALTGHVRQSSWYSKEEPCDFYDLKGVLENFFGTLHMKDVAWTALPADQCTCTRKGYSAAITIGGKAMGMIGKVHQDVLDRYDIRQDVFLFELNLAELAPLISRDREAGPIPRYPFVTRDTTIICANEVQAGEILDSLRSTGEELVEQAELIDLYTGDPIPAGKKSLSFRIIYRSPSKTLKDKEVNKVHTTITQMLLDRFNANLPG